MAQQQVELIKFDSEQQQQPQQEEIIIPQQEIKENSINSLTICQKFKLHTFLLLKKNYIITKRNKKQTFFLFLTPFLMILWLLFWENLASSIYQFEVIDPEIIPNIKLEKCIPPFDSDDTNCITVSYAIIGPRESWIDYVMEYVAKTNDLEFGKDIKMVVQGSPEEFNNFLIQNPNRTKFGVIFCTSSWPIYKNIDIPCKFDMLQDQKLVFYSIVQNWTLSWKSPYLQNIQAAYPKDQQTNRLKTSIDNALFNLFEQNDIVEASIPVENPNEIFDKKILKPHNFKEKLFIESQDYPKFTSRFLKGYDMASQSGTLFFFVPYMLHFIMNINEILREKSKKLREGICVMGMTHYSYWFSWILTTVVKSTILVFVFIGSCHIFNIQVITNVPVLIVFLYSFSYDFSIQSIGFMITTLCTNLKDGYTIAYSFLLLSLVMQGFLSNNFFLYFLYIEDQSALVDIVRSIFNLYPSFHYSKIYGDIAYKSGQHFVLEDGMWHEGETFLYKYLTEINEGDFRMPGGKKHYSAPTILESYIYLNLCTVLFLLLAWYFDNVLQGNRGTVETPLFFLSCDYWKGYKTTKTKRKLSQQDKTIKEIDNQQDIDTVSKEKKKVLKNFKENKFVSGMRIRNLGKTYSKYPFGIKSKKDVIALKNVYLEIEEGEILAILGHNGAGKSTLINVLTGIISPTNGNAEILNEDIRSNMDIIRTLIGVCPQFDVLWDELTAQEHLNMFCQVKGINEQQIQYEIDSTLKSVNLLQYKNSVISTFSGGMKRRISLAISTIGNPNIIFMDEPTTGMDPKSRRDVWQVIRNIKKGKSIILTTHGMDEADALSDRIAVINEGQISCIGTSLYLKNTFGDGYRLTIISEKQNIEFVKQFIFSIIPSSIVLSESGGSILFGVPIIKSNELSIFFKIMESDIKNENSEQFKSYIRDWGISHSTLEEVFMKITKKNSKYFE